MPAWLQRVSAERKAGDLLRPDPADDVADPFRLTQRHYDVMVAEVSEAIDVLVSALWVGRRQQSPSPAAALPETTEGSWDE